MALIECKECRKKVSDMAESCPGCGYPIRMGKTNEKYTQELIDPKDYVKVFKPKFLDSYEGFSVDKNNRLARYGTFGEVFSFDDILSVEIYENDYSLTKTGTASMLGRATIGSLINPLGAVIGGATAKKRTVDIVNKMEVIISVKNTRKPIISVPINVSKKTKRGSKEYNNAIKKAKGIEATIKEWMN